MKAFKKIWSWVDDRTGIGDLVVPLATHKVPPGSGWWYVFGSATLFCLMLQIVTGIALAFMYQPSASTAYKSLVYINNQVPLGQLLRGLHYFGASAMILLVGIHMIRVFVMAAYKYPREMSWITGVFLLLLTVAMGFTGQILRWDDVGMWTIVVAAEQAGRIPFIGTYLARFLTTGKTMGGFTLSHIYAFHVFLIPAILFALVGLHVYMVIHNGISEPPEQGRPVDPKKYRGWYESMLEKKGVPFWPDAMWRDIVFSFVVLIAIIVLAIFMGAPKLGGPPNLTHIDVVPTPDWYLTWIYSLYALMPPSIENFVIFFGPIAVGAILLAIPFLANKGERSPLKRPWSMAGVIVTVAIVFAFWYEGTLAPWSPHFNTKPIPASIVSKNNPEARKGAQLFYKKGCQYCHKIDGRGGIRGPNLSEIGQKLTPHEMTIRIVNGGGYMPAFGSSLSKKQLQEIVAFLQTRRTSTDHPIK